MQEEEVEEEGAQEEGEEVEERWNFVINILWQYRSCKD